jgi:hypothetical protein
VRGKMTGIRTTADKKTTGNKHPLKIGANIFISFIGAGILGLPYAFKKVSMIGKQLLEASYLH